MAWAEVQRPWQGISEGKGTLLEGQNLDFTMGYRFTSEREGFVVRLGGYFVGKKRVYIWDGATEQESSRVRSVEVESGNEWAYERLMPPVHIEAGKTYTVAVNLVDAKTGRGSGGSRIN